MKLYTLPHCPKCELAQDKLFESKYTYEIVCDLEQAISLGIKVAPCLVTDSGRQYGLKEILSICKGEGQFE